MNGSQFDTLARSLSGKPSRRALLCGVPALGLATIRRPEPASARKRKRKKKQVKRNAFGCVNVGGKCRGKDSNCCSGICQGKKPKKGKKDRSRCVAHDTGGCTVDRHLCLNPTVTACSAASTTASCLKTTGNAGFCAEGLDLTPEANCHPCRRDPDCEALGFGAGSACVILHTEGICLNGCEGINGSAGTACVPPAAP